jgi:hypothetical protein
MSLLLTDVMLKELEFTAVGNVWEGERNYQNVTQPDRR